MERTPAQEALVACFLAGVAAVEPAAAVARALREHPPRARRVVVFALGKAAPAMVRGAAAALESTPLVGVAVSNHLAPVPPGIRLIVGGHPFPNDGSVVAGRAFLELAGRLAPDDLALVLISGGGSALAEAPLPGLALADLVAVTDELLRSGAPIEDVNLIRARLSRLKGGGLGRAILPTPLLTLVLSDVVGDRLEVIASGPTVPDPRSAGDIRTVVERWGLQQRLAPAILTRLLADDLRPSGPIEQDVLLVGSGSVAAHGAADAGRRHGWSASVVDTRITGEATGAVFEALERRRPGLSVFAGETTVSVTGSGNGGRNQEAALAAAIHLEGRPGIAFLAGGTDGIDGTTTAAGAVVDAATIGRGRGLGRDASDYLDRNDSGGYFTDLPDRIVTGPTGTNVGDLWLVLS
jgi:glycerate 2-kinase